MPEEVKVTKNGTKYLTEPNVYVVAHSQIPIWTEDNEHLGPCNFLDVMGGETYEGMEAKSNGEYLCMFAGQLCYLSFGENRTKDPTKYFKRILESGHGSVLEHCSVTFLFSGIDRSVTHELVRHRAGWAYSQVSQRYVDGDKLRFVEPLEFQSNEKLHKQFENDIDGAVDMYESLGVDLLLLQTDERCINGDGGLTGTERRKQVNQVARCILPNFTEAPIMATANLRSIRHFLEQRSNPHADNKISRLAFKVGEIVTDMYKDIFQDFTQYEQKDSFGNTLKFWKNEYRKV